MLDGAGSSRFQLVRHASGGALCATATAPAAVHPQRPTGVKYGGTGGSGTESSARAHHAQEPIGGLGGRQPHVDGEAWPLRAVGVMLERFAPVMHRGVQVAETPGKKRSDLD